MEEERMVEISKSGAASSVTRVWEHVIDQYGIPLAQFIIATIYSIYCSFTPINVMIFTVKYLPSGICMYTFLKSIYFTSRQRLKSKKAELEEIEMQIEIINTKLCDHNSEFTERAGQLKREEERLQRVRARIRALIATDEVLQKSFDQITSWQGDEAELQFTTTDTEGCLDELLEVFKNNQVPRSDVAQNEKLQSGEYVHSDTSLPENREFSAGSDTDLQKEFRIKIVKVTNVYKVAYLRHYIKLKRLRRANKQALLKKKMENVKMLLEDWQKTLNMVINSKLYALDKFPVVPNKNVDESSEKAMGDFTKPNFQTSDSESERTNEADQYDEYNGNWLNWNFYEENQERAGVRRFGEPYEHRPQCECGGSKDSNVSLASLPLLPEETGSQLALEALECDALPTLP